MTDVAGSIPENASNLNLELREQEGSFATVVASSTQNNTPNLISNS